MKRQRRTRRIYRRGVHHISDMLSLLVNEIEQDQASENPRVSPDSLPAAPATTISESGIGQATFAFYQTAGG